MSYTPACSMPPMRSNINYTAGRGALQDGFIALDLAEAASAARGTAECTVLDTIGSEWG